MSGFCMGQLAVRLKHKVGPLFTTVLMVLGSQACTVEVSQIENNRGGETDSLQPPTRVNCAELEQSSNLVHRLSRREYRNAILDLTGQDVFELSDVELPNDLVADKFEHFSDTLTVDYSRLKAFTEVAEKVAPSVVSDYLNDECSNQADADCAEKIIDQFAKRAYRRPPSESKKTDLLNFFHAANAKVNSEDALAFLVESILTDPSFLYRLEKGVQAGETDQYTLDAYELASRLSFLLWASIPDEELLEKAADGTLLEKETLVAQYRRMIQSGRSGEMVRYFGEQILQMRALRDMQTDVPLASDFEEETMRFLDSVLRSNDHISKLLTANYSYTNSALDDHYGLSSSSSSSSFKKKTFDAADLRGGLLTHGSILTLTSQLERTVPSSRGRWVTQTLLCEDIGDPPPDAQPVADEIDPTLPIRERMDIVGANPSCASCHAIMDPIGFGLENYGPTGVLRSEYLDGTTVDSSGTLPNGVSFNGPTELSEIIANDTEFYECFAKQFMEFAMARTLSRQDSCYAAELGDALRDSNTSFPNALQTFIESDQFRTFRRESSQ